jgi:hypothetical protein
MTKVCNFVSGLARAGKSANEIKILTDAAFGDKSLSKTAIYNIFLSKVKAGETTDDQRHLNMKKTKRTQDIIAAVATDVNADRRVTSWTWLLPMGSHMAPCTTSCIKSWGW